MSTDLSADLFFGFLVEEKVSDLLTNDESIIPDGMAMVFAGDAYSDKMQTFVAVGESIHGVVSWREYSSFLGKKNFTEPKEAWEPALKEFAKKLGVKAKIGWYICTSMG